MFPWPLGLGAFGTYDACEEVLQTLLRLQGEGGYPSDDSTARVRELMMWSIELGLGIGGLDSAFLSIFPHIGAELLEDHEARFIVPNDAARTIEERQKRLRLWSAGKRLGKDLTLPQLLALADVTVTTAQTKVADLAPALAEKDGSLATALKIADAQWGPKARRTVAALARLITPVAAYGQHNFATAEEMVRSDSGATWDGPQILGRAGIISGGTGLVTQRAPSRTRSYVGTECLRARDLNRMQDAILIGPGDGADNLLNGQGFHSGTLRAFSVEIDPGAPAELVNGDFRNRLVRIWLRQSATDIRPGQAGDIGLNTATAYNGLLYTGDGTAPYQQTIPSSSSCLIYGDSSGLHIHNATGALRYFVGIIEISDKVVGGSGGAADVSDGDTLAAANVDAGFWTRLRNAAMRAGDGPDLDAWTGFPTTGYGGAVRAGVLAISERPASNQNIFHIDGTMDWRDRLVAILPVGHDGAGSPNFPGTVGDDALAASGFIFGYTGDGEAGGAGDYNIPVQTLFDVYAGSGFGGTLFIQHRSTSTIQTLCTGFLIIASEQLGKRVVATAATHPTAPAASDPVEAFHLNWVQDVNVCTQVRGRPKTDLFGGEDSDAMPLGPIVSGTPKIPVVWRMGPRSGSRIYNLLSATERDYTEEVRQPGAAGRLRRLFSCSIANGATKTLDTNDWRDRMLFAILAQSASDLTVGGASDTAINTTANHVVTNKYLGAGGDSSYAATIIANILIYADASTGHLKVKNTSGATRYLTGVLDGSFPLGPRHPVTAG